MIPQIIHQIYDNNFPPPQHLLEMSKSWINLHPDWIYRLWDKDQIYSFLNENYSKYVLFYNSLPFDAQRWDFIRYLILYHFGGLYVDMDYESRKPITDLIKGSTCCLGLEPSGHSYCNQVIIGNALMATIPRHPFIKIVIDEIVSNRVELLNKKLQIMESTGPYMITREYIKYENKDDVSLLPAALVAPLTIWEIKMLINGNRTKEIDSKIKEAFALHYFLGSWLTQTNVIF